MSTVNDHDRTTHTEFMLIPDQWTDKTLLRWLQTIDQADDRLYLGSCYHCTHCGYTCHFLPSGSIEVTFEQNPGAFLQKVFGQHISELSRDKFMRALLCLLKDNHILLLHTILKAAAQLGINDDEMKTISKSIKSR